MHSSTCLRDIIILFSTFSISMALSTPMKVVVSGAGGQTGQSLFRKMLALPDEFDPIGLVRTAESKQALVRSDDFPASAVDKVMVVDVTNADEVKRVVTDGNFRAFCICSSAKPVPEGVDEATGRPIFGFPNGQPEVVDWQGQKNQIDACGPDAHVVICSSMGGTDPNHMLNSIGRTGGNDNDGDGGNDDDGSTTTGGNILKWKRKTEVYLTESGRPYTIVHPGGLLNEKGSERELVLNVDDSMEGTESRSVPREDVAEVMLNALRHGDLYRNRSFDLRAKPVGDGSPTTDFRTLIESLGDKNCDYSLGEIA